MYSVSSVPLTKFTYKLNTNQQHSPSTPSLASDSLGRIADRIVQCPSWSENVETLVTYSLKLWESIKRLCLTRLGF